MNLLLPFFILVSSFFGMLAANAQEVSEEGVQFMKSQYYEKIANLPESRNCLPSDTQDNWVEQTTITLGTKPEKPAGFHIIRFGRFNQFAEKYAVTPAAVANAEVSLEDTNKQYIVSVRGLLYFYEGNKLRSTHLCFVATQTKSPYIKGEVLLMDLVGDNKPLSVTVYRPSSVIVEKEKKYGR